MIVNQIISAMRTTLFFLFSLAYLLFVSCEEEKVDALQEQPKAQKMIHHVNLECIIANIHNAPDALRRDTSWVKAEVFKCVNQSFEEFGIAAMDKATLEESWQSAMQSLEESDTSSQENDFVLLYIPKDLIANKNYTAADTTFLSEMTVALNVHDDADIVLNFVDQYIALIENEKVELSKQAKDDFLVWLRITRDEVIFAKKLIADLGE